MARKKKTEEEKTAKKLKTKKPRAAPRKPKSPKEIELIEVIDEDTQINIHVQLNEENEINCIELLDEENTQEQELELPDGNNTQEQYVERQLDVDDPELIQTTEGFTIAYKDDQTEVEHVCGKCAKSFKTFRVSKKRISVRPL
jgi:hypothetical protein